jgi:hypothetical protein
MQAAESMISATSLSTMEARDMWGEFPAEYRGTLLGIRRVVYYCRA